MHPLHHSSLPFDSHEPSEIPSFIAYHTLFRLLDKPIASCDSCRDISTATASTERFVDHVGGQFQTLREAF